MIQRKKRMQGVIYLGLSLCFFTLSSLSFCLEQNQRKKDMEKESKKRARDGEDEKALLETAKKQSMMEEDEERFKALSDNYLALGVFDFPWLKEGITSKSDDWKFEDAFASSLNTYNGLEVYGQRLCDTPQPQPLLVDDLRVVEADCVLDLEGVDCFWTSLLNQPLSPPAFH